MTTDEHDCAEAVARLYEYLDGELDGEYQQVIEVHLSHCSPCLEAFDFESELKRMIASKCAERMPDDLRRRLLELLRGSENLSP
jgi:mycothiol system anti-sigma-R factor